MSAISETVVGDSLQKSEHFPAVIALLIGLWLGGFGVGIIYLFNLDPSAPIELTADERIGAHFQPTFPATFYVSIVPPSDIKKNGSPNAFAYTVLGSSDRYCHIFLPTGEAIEFNSIDASARWQSQFMADAVAHEILHCLRGSWHPHRG